MPEGSQSSQSESQIFIPLRHGTIYWTMVGDEAIAGPFDVSADAQSACRGVFGAWVKTVGVTVDAR